MKIFVYPYSPTTIGFDPEFDGYVITTANAFERYLKLGFLKEKIEIAESIDFKHVFRIVRDLVERFSDFDEVFTLKENDIEWIDVINDYFLAKKTSRLWHCLRTNIICVPCFREKSSNLILLR